MSEAANQMMAAAASAISVVLGQEVDISPPETRVVDDTKRRAQPVWHRPPRDVNDVSHWERGMPPDPARPERVRRPDGAGDRRTRARAADGDGDTAAAGSAEAGSADTGVSVHEALEGITLRVWAELGRTQLPLGSAVDLPLGAVVDLDCGADAPVDIFVNGLLFAQGQLLVTDDGEWAVSLETLRGQALPAAPETDAQPQLKGALT